ncbi:hypothetical protein IFM89_036376 [Coptis chinensis]|uniref:Transposase-associated domain-containing protein n=1 Tax=Coptis chinensis TaxID=261450 RepID=A0A835HDT7_9MAGN|nr:hypothetical protein IFM89_036376 [Coptis chinensis]
MNELDRFGDVYKQGVADFIQFATVNNRGSTTCLCPCRECRNRKSFVFGTISRHLIRYGMDKNYRVWVLHGENPCTDPVVEPVIEEENTEAEGLGMGNFVDASYVIKSLVFLSCRYPTIYRNRISPDPIFLTLEASSVGGFYALNRRGQVLLATVNEATIVTFVSGQVVSPWICLDFKDLNFRSIAAPVWWSNELRLLVLLFWCKFYETLVFL